MSTKKKVIISLTTCITALLIILAVLSLIPINYKNFNYPSSKIWRHRAGENLFLISKVLQHLASGYSGIELDVNYDEITDQLYFTYVKEELTTKNTLAKVINELQNKNFNNIYIWLDIKNLTVFNAYSIYKKLNEIFTNKAQYSRVIVESQNIISHTFFSFFWPQCILWLSPWNDPQTAPFKRILSKLALKTGNFMGISMDVQYINNPFVKQFGKAPKFIFTIDDVSTLKKLNKHNDIKVILSDNPYNVISQL